MIGTDLALTLPALSDTLAVIVSKIATALSAIEVSIADKATQAALNITGALDLNGNILQNLTSVKLATGAVPTAPGSLYYASNELWFVDTTGAVKITANGAVNIASSGGFVGDYGTGGSAASYDSASSQYRFYSNLGGAVFADLSARAVYLNANAHAVALKGPAALSASYSVTFPTALPGTAGVVRMATDGTLTVTPTVTYTLVVPAGAAFPDPGGAPTSAPHAGCFVTTGAIGRIACYPIALPIGATITGYTMRWTKATNAATQLVSALFGWDNTGGGGGNNFYASPGTGTETNNSNAPGTISTSITGLSQTIAAGQQYFVECTQSAATSGDRAFSCEVTYTLPTSN